MDIRNPIVSTVAGQWMPAPFASDTGTATINWNVWGGDPATWTVSTAQTNTCSQAMLRVIGSAIASVIAGGAPTTVAPAVGGDPECVVSTSTVGGRANITLQFRNATTHANLGSVAALDNVVGVYSYAPYPYNANTYALWVGRAFAESKVYDL